MSYHVHFHAGILLIKPLQPQTHLSAALGHYALCVYVCVCLYLHSLAGVTGMLKAFIISMEITRLLTKVVLTCQLCYVLLECIEAQRLNCVVKKIKVLQDAGKHVSGRPR